MPRYLLKIGEGNQVTRPIEAENLNEAASHAFVAAALYLPSAGRTPDLIKIVVTDMAQNVLATILFTTAL